MRPEQKSTGVEKLQQLQKIVLMIEDGANDCAAIKQAYVGVSFAQNDAAYSAPYSSSNDNIDLCSLQNALEVFQYYVGASIKYVAAMIVMAQGYNFSDIQQIVINCIGSLAYLKSLSFSKPSITLTRELLNESMMAMCINCVVSFQIILASIGQLQIFFIGIVLHGKMSELSKMEPLLKKEQFNLLCLNVSNVVFVFC